MAGSGRGRDDMCLNHPDRAAATRCAACHKPVCQECIVSSTDGKFCSRQCAERTADFRAQAGKHKKGMGTLIGKIKSLIWLIIIIALLYVGYKIFIKGEGKTLKKQTEQMLREGGEAAGNAADTVKDKANELTE